MSRPAVSQHLKVLKDAGLVTDMKQGTRRLYQLDPEGVARLRAHFDQMWTKAMSAFKHAAENHHQQEKNMANTVEAAVVRKSVRVAASVERAFSVFVEQMETWWPATHHIGKTPFRRSLWSPAQAGVGMSAMPKARPCEWGSVLKWEPPHRVTFSWHVGAGSRLSRIGHFDPDMAKASEVEIRFMADGPGTTWWNWSTASWSAMARVMSSCARCSMGRGPGQGFWRSLRRSSVRSS